MAFLKTTLQEASDFIIASAKQMCDDLVPAEAVMLHSSPGVGKSAVIVQSGEAVKDMFEQAFNAKFKIWDVRVGAQQESDIQGIPYPTTVDVVDGLEIKDMMFSTPSWFPREGECGILLMDELANAPIPNQHACYRTIHDRSIHNGRKLPDGVMIVAAGNTKEDKTGAKGIVPALARRFQAHFFIEPSAEEFMAHAMQRKFHPAVVGFIGHKPAALVSTALTGEYGFACPANYESTSKILKNAYMTPALREMGIASCLGSSIGMDFIGFLRNEKWLPNYKVVGETGEYTLPDGADTDRGIMFTIVSSTAMQILDRIWDEKYTDKEVDNLAEILNKFDVSTAGIAFRSMKRADKKALSKIMTGNFTKLRTVLQDVLTRTEAMASGK